MWRNQNFFNEDLLIEDLLDLYPILAVPSPALITSLPSNISPNKRAPNRPNSVLRNPLFCSLASFLIVSLTPFKISLLNCSKIVFLNLLQSFYSYL